MSARRPSCGSHSPMRSSPVNSGFAVRISVFTGQVPSIYLGGWCGQGIESADGFEKNGGPETGPPCHQTIDSCYLSSPHLPSPHLPSPCLSSPHLPSFFLAEPHLPSAKRMTSRSTPATM